MLIARDISTQRSDTTRLKRITFDVQRGTSVQLLGPNGVGKSTFLKSLVGLYPRTGYWGYQDACIPAKDIFFAGHDKPLLPHLSVLDNLNYYAALHRADIDTTVLHAVDLWPESSVGRLSAGQQQRLSLLLGMALKRPVWLLDEPYSALDTHASAWLDSAIQAHLNTGGYLIFVSHQPAYPATQTFVLETEQVDASD